ncbi:MAG: hypothetical protein CBC24_05205 [Candidatus Pelagibacter sp. TMED64]|nr:hypothetical protein [Candidatus Pelagibacter sp.]OUU65523.1 MAG: hypothetical protein CBC24_05205 [Candidatus Pelagibacter sp. TMED64]|tara:strand:- start:3461 stop:4549 length:1089 start_codon:yes stop_codon:yes gene_type:complete
MNKQINKGDNNMKKMTKIGLSALAGSLALSAANAGDFGISGSVTISNASRSASITDDTAGASTSGARFGMSRAFTLTGAGELDNGYSWTYFAASATDGGSFGWTSSGMTMDLDGMGQIGWLNKAGPLDAIDDVAPTAWEEVSDGIFSRDQAGGISGGYHVDYYTPELALGTVVRVAYAPEISGTPGDKGTAAGSAGQGSGQAISINTKPVDGLSMGAAYSKVDQVNTTSFDDDKEEAIAYVKYAIGPITVGYQRNVEVPNENGGTTSGNATNSVQYYDETSWGVSFQVNDNLSISYGEITNTKDFGTNDDSDTNVDAEAKGINVAYNLGGATLKILHSSSDNNNYVTTDDRDQTVVALGLAF